VKQAYKAFRRMQNGGNRNFFAKMVVLATLFTLRLVFILMKFRMTAACRRHLEFW